MTPSDHARPRNAGRPDDQRRRSTSRPAATLWAVVYVALIVAGLVAVSVGWL